MEFYVCYPVRCRTCGNPIGHLAENYEIALELGNTPGEALDAAGLELYCCRSALMNPTRHPYRADVTEVVFGMVAVENWPAKQEEQRLAAAAARAARANPLPDLAAVPVSAALPSLLEAPLGLADNPAGLEPLVASAAFTAEQLRSVRRPYEHPFEMPDTPGVPTFNPLRGAGRVRVKTNPLASTNSSNRDTTDWTDKLTGATYLAV